MKLQRLPYIALGLLLLTTLLNINLFQDLSYSAFYFFCILSSVVVLVSSIITLKKDFSIIMPRPIAYFTVLVLYYFLQGLLLTGTGIGEQHLYLLISLLLFITIFSWANNGLITIIGTSRVITLLLVLESFYCFLQFAEILPSRTPNFKVTGSWINPNATALFLAMGFPALLHLLFNEEKLKNRVLLSIIIVCGIAALLLLNCRTAFIAIATSTFIQLNGKYKIFERTKASIHKPLTILLLLILLIATIGSSYFMYQNKTASANGRIFIWKVSLSTALEKPFAGHGYGFFARNYNLQQAEYFSKGEATVEEIKNSNYVLLAYNEFIQQFVEGGLIAFILTIAFLFSLLSAAIKNKPPASYTLTAGIVSFLIIAFFNFAIQGVPIFFLLIIYSSFACQNPVRVSNIANSKNKSPLLLNRAKAFILSIASLFILLLIASKANTSMQNREATLLLQQGKINEATEIFETITERHQTSVDSWIKLANAYFIQKRFNDALLAFEKAEAFSSQPEIFLRKGFCQMQLNNVSVAIESCKTAMNIAPNHLEPMYALMNISIFKKDTAGALVYARGITEQVPKKQSEQVVFYKKQALAFIKKTTKAK